MRYSAELIKPKSWFTRLDVFPFIFLYGLLIQASLTWSEGLFVDIALVLVVLLNCIAYLMNHWS